MVQIISAPRVIPAAGSPPKNISEFFGRMITGTEEVSIAMMKSPPGWSEPGQVPDFDEYTIVLSGTLVVTTKMEEISISDGQAIMAPAGDWVKYSSPDGADYLAICLPAFSPDLVHRDEHPDTIPIEFKPGDEAIQYNEAGIEGLDTIEDLWYKLREHHASHARNFSHQIRARSYSERKNEITRSNEGRSLLVQTAYTRNMNTPVGFCISSGASGEKGEIESIFVDPPYRSRGIGSHFVNNACMWMENIGVKEMGVGVCEGNEGSFGFYQQFGFYLRRHYLLRRTNL